VKAIGDFDANTKPMGSPKKSVQIPRKFKSDLLIKKYSEKKTRDGE